MITDEEKVQQVLTLLKKRKIVVFYWESKKIKDPYTFISKTKKRYATTNHCEVFEMDFYRSSFAWFFNLLKNRRQMHLLDCKQDFATLFTRELLLQIFNFLAI